MKPPLSSALAGALRDRRTDLNQRFERARHQYPQLEPDDLSSFLRECVDDVVVAVERESPTAIAPVVSAAYDAALILCGQKLVGQSSSTRVIAAGWKHVLPAAAALLAQAPSRILAAVSNALHTLAGTSGARPLDWIDALTRLAPRCPDVTTFLCVGQVLGWRAGLAHLRASALDTAARLPPDLAMAAVGATSGDWPTLLARLHEDVWFDPGQTTPAAPGPRIAKEAGAFRGLGGLFLVPPQVAATDGGWLVRSAEQHWYLALDAFGVTFHRATVDEWNAVSHEPRLPPDTALAGATLRQGSATLALPTVGPITSAAAAGSTVALTSAHTHSIAFVALA